MTSDALAALKKLSLARPADPLVDYNIACLYLRQGSIQESIRYLKKAIDKGFQEWKTLEDDPDMVNVRGSIMFKKIMKDTISQDN